MDRPPYRIAPPSDTLGLYHAWEALRDIEYPLDTRRLRERYGRWRMPITGVEFDTLDHWLEGVPEQTFRSQRGVVRAIARAHPELRA